MKKLYKSKYGLFLTMVLFFIIPLVLPSYVAKAAKSTIELNKTSITAYAGGDKVKLKITGTDQTVTWKSSDSNIAKVTTSGNVYGLKKGTTTITATVDGKSYKSEVNVKDPYVSPKTVELTLNSTESLTLIGFDDQSSIKWTSNDKSIATVSSKGKVTGKKEGTATITATINKKIFTRKVVVKKIKSISSEVLASYGLVALKKFVVDPSSIQINGAKFGGDSVSFSQLDCTFENKSGGKTRAYLTIQANQAEESGFAINIDTNTSEYGLVVVSFSKYENESLTKSISIDSVEKAYDTLSVKKVSKGEYFEKYYSWLFNKN